MKILFLYSGSESMGVESLSAHLKAAGHETALVFDPAIFSGSRGRDNPLLERFFDPGRDSIIKAALEHEPHVLACSCVTGNYQWALDIAGEVKKLSKKPVAVIFGGVHPTLVPENVIARDEVDAVVVGEGEGAVLELVQSVDGGRITDTSVKNAWVKSEGTVHRNPLRPYIRDMDAMPFLDKELFYEKVPFLRKGHMLLTARGCPYDCTFCSNGFFHEIYDSEKNHIRRYSPGRVIEELEYHMRRGAPDFINIYDDIFTLDRKWLEEFVPMYKSRVNLPFICNIHPNHCREEIISLLKEAGCLMVRMGVNSLHIQTLRKELGRGGSREKVSDALRMLKKYRIRCKAEHILGLPQEGIDIQVEALRFYNENRPTKIQTFWLIPFPGTKIMEKAKERGHLTPEVVKALEEGSSDITFSTFQPNTIMGNNVEELKHLSLLFDLLPALPKSVVKWILDRKIYRSFPYSHMVHQFLLVLNALINRDLEDVHSMLYVFARKRTP